MEIGWGVVPTRSLSGEVLPNACGKTHVSDSFGMCSPNHFRRTQVRSQGMGSPKHMARWSPGIAWEGVPKKASGGGVGGTKQRFERSPTYTTWGGGRQTQFGVQHCWNNIWCAWARVPAIVSNTSCCANTATGLHRSLAM